MNYIAIPRITRNKHDSIEVAKVGGSVVNVIPLGRELVGSPIVSENTATVTVRDSQGRLIMETYQLPSGAKLSTQQL